MFAEIISRADSERSRRRSTVSILGLMKHLDAQLKVLQDLTGDGGAVEAEIPGCVVKRKLAAAATKGRGRAPVFLSPDGQEYRGVGISRLRRAWQEDAGEHAHVESERVLVKKPVFCGKLDVAWSEGGRAVRWSIIAKRHGSGELSLARPHLGDA